MNKIIDDIGGTDDSDFKIFKEKEKNFSSVKNRIFPFKGYNFMMDLLFLPHTKDGYKYLLVICDLETNNFDFEPLKNKTPLTVLNALKTISKRPYIQPKEGANFQVDSGAEFKGLLKSFLYDNGYLLRVAKKGRHKQMSVVERLNKTLSRLLNSYMNAVELKTDKPFNEWNNKEVLNLIREKVNKFREEKERGLHFVNMKPLGHPKFKVGDIIKYRLDVPENALAQEQQDINRFREGDRRWSRFPHKITQVLRYPTKYRYMLNNMDNVSYVENDLKHAEEDQELFKIKKILDKKKIKGKIYYLVWWDGYRKKDATYEPRTELIKTAKELIKDFDKKAKK